MIVATAGHIDHGKTTLIKALTGVDTDRLPEEKARGISIDLGFAYWDTSDGRSVGFVDVPGHEKFARNMLAGVCGIDCALLVVAADDGVMPQTREHLHIVDLLGISRGIAVITKSDRVAAERVAEVEAEVRALLAATTLRAAEVLPVSAISGAGIEALRAALSAAAADCHRAMPPGRQFRHAVDRAFVVAGSGTVVTGTVFDGAVAVGDRLVLSPSGLPVRVRGIQQRGLAVTSAAAGERCALNLAGVDLADVQRGDWVLAPALHAPSDRLDVQLHLLAGETHPLQHWTPVHIHLGTRDLTGRVAMRRGEAVAPGATALAQLVLDQPAAALHGDRCILRDQSATRTLGGAVVLDPWPPRQRRNPAQRLRQLQALESPDAAAALRGLVDCTPGGVDLAPFARSFNLDAAALAALVAALDLVVLGKTPSAALPRSAVETMKAAAIDAVARFHKTSPQASGIDVRALRAVSAPDLAVPVFEGLLHAMVADKRIEWIGSIVRRPAHTASDNPADQQTWERIRPILQEAALPGIVVADVAREAGIREPLLVDFLHRKARTGEVIRVGTARFYLRTTMAGFAAIANLVAGAAEGNRFPAGAFRDRAGVGRTLAIEVLETLDRLGVTQRVGDARVMRNDFAAILGHAEAPPAAARPAAAPPPATRRDAPVRPVRR